MSGAERRQWPRIPASLLSNVTASIIAGPDVRLVNLSRGGALMEVSARYPMRSKVRLKLTRPGGAVTQVHGIVSWAKVASISNGKINYLLAVIFDVAIEDLSAATGIDDVENHASVAMVADPFEGTEASGAALTLPPVVPADLPAAASTDVSSAPVEPPLVEEDLSAALFTDPGVIAPHPSSAIVQADAAAAAIAAAAGAEVLAAASVRAEELRQELERAVADLAALSAANDNLSAQLHAYDEDRVRLRGELEAARQNWDEEKSTLTREAAETVARVHELQAALLGHQQSGGQALAEQQALVQTLSMRLETLETERTALRSELASERQRWEEERAVVAREAAEAVARATDLQAALERRNQESGAALAEAQARIGDLERALHEHSGSQEEAIARARTREQELLSRLQAFDAERHELHTRVEHERHTWQDERQTLAAAANDAQARVAELESALHAQHEAHERALAEARVTQQDLQARLDAHDAERGEWIARSEAERHAWQAERQTLAAAAAEAQARVGGLESTLHAQHEAHERALAEARVAQQDLQARLDAHDAERAEWIARGEAERHAWQDERMALAAAGAAAAASITTLEAALLERDATHAQALADAHALHQQLEGRLATFQGDLSDWQAGRDAERAAWHEERIGLGQQLEAAAVRLETLEEELRGRQGAVAEQQATVLSLTARLEVSDAERTEVQRELADERWRRDTERSRWETERSDLVAEAASRTEEFQAALEAREQIHAEAITREQSRFEELIAELMQAANDQQSEYQQLMAERTAALEEQVSRVERVSAELVRVRTEAEMLRTSFEARCRQLEARLEAADATAAAQEQRQREACREAERLVALLAAPAAAVPLDQSPLFAADNESAQAVA